jgi:copper chaperone CopZ
MLPRMKWTFALAVAATAALASTVSAAPKTSNTTITIKGMHCQSCAKKVMTRLNLVSGVKTAQVNAKKGRAIVFPKDTRHLPSPRTQWEAVEKAGFKPVKLQGPYGTFTKKPKT